MTSRDLADLLTESRRAAGLSKEQLARRHGITAQVIGKWEHQAGALPWFATYCSLLETCGVQLIPRPVKPHLTAIPTPGNRNDRRHRTLTE